MRSLNQLPDQEAVYEKLLTQKESNIAYLFWAALGVLFNNYVSDEGIGIFDWVQSTLSPFIVGNPAVTSLPGGASCNGTELIPPINFPPGTAPWLVNAMTIQNDHLRESEVARCEADNQRFSVVFARNSAPVFFLLYIVTIYFLNRGTIFAANSRHLEKRHKDKFFETFFNMLNGKIKADYKDSLNEDTKRQIREWIQQYCCMLADEADYPYFRRVRPAAWYVAHRHGSAIFGVLTNIYLQPEWDKIFNNQNSKDDLAYEALRVLHNKEEDRELLADVLSRYDDFADHPKIFYKLMNIVLAVESGTAFGLIDHVSNSVVDLTKFKDEQWEIVERLTLEDQAKFFQTVCLMQGGHRDFYTAFNEQRAAQFDQEWYLPEHTSPKEFFSRSPYWLHGKYNPFRGRPCQCTNQEIFKWKLFDTNPAAYFYFVKRGLSEGVVLGDNDKKRFLALEPHQQVLTLRTLLQAVSRPSDREETDSNFLKALAQELYAFLDAANQQRFALALMDILITEGHLGSYDRKDGDADALIFSAVVPLLNWHSAVSREEARGEAEEGEERYEPDLGGVGVVDHRGGEEEEKDATPDPETRRQKRRETGIVGSIRKISQTVPQFSWHHPLPVLDKEKYDSSLVSHLFAKAYFWGDRLTDPLRAAAFESAADFLEDREEAWRLSYSRSRQEQTTEQQYLLKAIETFFSGEQHIQDAPVGGVDEEKGGGGGGGGGDITRAQRTMREFLRDKKNRQQAFRLFYYYLKQQLRYAQDNESKLQTFNSASSFFCILAETESQQDEALFSDSNCRTLADFLLTSLVNLITEMRTAGQVITFDDRTQSAIFNFGMRRLAQSKELSSDQLKLLEVLSTETSINAGRIISLQDENHQALMFEVCITMISSLSNRKLKAKEMFGKGQLGRRLFCDAVVNREGGGGVVAIRITTGISYQTLSQGIRTYLQNKNKRNKFFDSIARLISHLPQDIQISETLLWQAVQANQNQLPIHVIKTYLKAKKPYPFFDGVADAGDAVKQAVLRNAVKEVFNGTDENLKKKFADLLQTRWNGDERQAEAQAVFWNETERRSSNELSSNIRIRLLKAFKASCDKLNEADHHSLKLFVTSLCRADQPEDLLRLAAAMFDVTLPESVDIFQVNFDAGSVVRESKADRDVGATTSALNSDISQIIVGLLTKAKESNKKDAEFIYSTISSYLTYKRSRDENHFNRCCQAILSKIAAQETDPQKAAELTQQFVQTLMTALSMFFAGVAVGGGGGGGGGGSDRHRWYRDEPIQHLLTPDIFWGESLNPLQGSRVAAGSDSREIRPPTSVFTTSSTPLLFSPVSHQVNPMIAAQEKAMKTPCYLVLKACADLLKAGSPPQMSMTDNPMRGRIEMLPATQSLLTQDTVEQKLANSLIALFTTEGISSQESRNGFLRNANNKTLLKELFDQLNRYANSTQKGQLAALRKALNFGNKETGADDRRSRGRVRSMVSGMETDVIVKLPLAVDARKGITTQESDGDNSSVFSLGELPDENRRREGISGSEDSVSSKASL